MPFEKRNLIVHIPSFNEANKIADLIANLRNQTVRDFQVTLHDDASTDKTPAVFARTAGQANLNHKLIINPVNLGLVRNFRKILLTAPDQSSKFLFASNHEQYNAEHIDVLLSGADNNRTALTYSDSFLICDKTGVAVDGFQAPDIDTSSLDRVESFAKVMQNYTFANPLWGLYNSKLSCMASPFPFGRGGDHAFIAGISLTGTIKFIREKTWIRYRNQSRTLIDFARLESATQDTTEIEELSKWPWLSFWNSHFEVITNSAISNSEKKKCIEISIRVCNQKSNGGLYSEMEKILSTRKGPISIFFNALTLNSLLKL